MDIEREKDIQAICKRIKSSYVESTGIIKTNVVIIGKNVKKHQKLNG